MLSQWLGHDIRAFNVFQYITLRAVLSTLTALSIGLVFGPALIRRLTAMKIGQVLSTVDFELIPEGERDEFKQRLAALRDPGVAGRARQSASAKFCGE